MKKILSGIIIAVISLFFTSSTFVGDVKASLSVNNDIKKPYFVSFKNGHVNISTIEKHGGKLKRKYDILPVAVVELSQEEAAQLENDTNISYIEEDKEVKAMGQVIPWGISHVEALPIQELGYKGTGIKVGVMDSGINNKHKDLSVAGGVSFIDSSSAFEDDYGHGTHVAGIIGALDNNRGVVGVSPEAKLYSIKVLDQYGKGNHSNIVAGLEWAIKNDLDIVNMSFGGDDGSSTLKAALDKAYDEGVLLVASAGNVGYTGKQSSISYPAAYKSVIAVGAIDNMNERAIFSSGGTELELMAPGVDIYSTFYRDYDYMSGTSMAAPHVTGVAAIILQNKGNSSNKEVRYILDNSAIPLGKPDYYGNGLISAENAINFVDSKKDK